MHTHYPRVRVGATGHLKEGAKCRCRVSSLTNSALRCAKSLPNLRLYEAAWTDGCFIKDHEVKENRTRQLLPQDQHGSTGMIFSVAFTAVLREPPLLALRTLRSLIPRMPRCNGAYHSANLCVLNWMRLLLSSRFYGPSRRPLHLDGNLACMSER